MPAHMADTENEEDRLLKKTILVTGGNSGIGLEACRILCKEGHRVIATVRSNEKGLYCLSEVRKVTNDADIHYMLCDISSPKSVIEFVEQFKDQWLRNGQMLDVLVNNAGISPPDRDRRTTCDHHPDWEIAVATNCLGPILLTDLLTDSLKITASRKGEARIVMVSSSIILFDTFMKYHTKLDDLMLANPRNYENGGQAYKNSKEALMMCTLAINDELYRHNIKITSICPGVVPNTNIGRDTKSSTKCCLFMLRCCCYCIVRPQSLHQGGNHIVDAAIREKGATGNGLFFARGGLKQPPQAMEKEKQVKMLKLVRKIVDSPLQEVSQYSTHENNGSSSNIQVMPELGKVDTTVEQRDDAEPAEEVLE